ncbi:hypothetical protein ACWCV9_32555 [Streptomyces sp. NPDC001606]
MSGGFGVRVVQWVSGTRAGGMHPLRDRAAGAAGLFEDAEVAV